MDFTFWNIIHLILAIMVVIIHFLASRKMLGCILLYQKTNDRHYHHSGWVNIFDKHGRDLGVYLIRLCLAGSAIMFTMNLWHIFTFMGEHMPSIKNVSWRVGNLIMAMICLILASEFEEESHNHESHNNAVS